MHALRTVAVAALSLLLCGMQLGALVHPYEHDGERLGRPHGAALLVPSADAVCPICVSFAGSTHGSPVAERLLARAAVHAAAHRRRRCVVRRSPAGVLPLARPASRSSDVRLNARRRRAGAAVAFYTDRVPAFQAILHEEGDHLRRFYARVDKLARLPKAERDRILDSYDARAGKGAFEPRCKLRACGVRQSAAIRTMGASDGHRLVSGCAHAKLCIRESRAVTAPRRES